MKLFYTPRSIVWLLCFAMKAHAQIQTTIQSGNWNDPAIWEFETIPADSHSVVILHPITISDSVFVQEIVIQNSLSVEMGGSLHVFGSMTVEESGNVDVYGSLVGYDGSEFLTSTSQQIHFKSGSTYEHRNSQTAGEPPSAIWDAASTLLISRYTNNGSLTSTRWQQSFGHFIYDCPNQGAFVDMLGNVRSIRGNFMVRNTGSNVLRLTLDRTTPTYITIEGDFIIEGNSVVWISRAATTHLHVLGNFDYKSTSAASSYITTTGNSALQVDGHVRIDSNGPFRFASSGGGFGRLRCKGEFTHIRGALAAEPGGNGFLEFFGEVKQEITFNQTLPSTITLTLDNAIGIDFNGNLNTNGNMYITRGNVKLPSVLHLGGSLIGDSTAFINATETTLILQGNQPQTLAFSGTTIHNVFITKSPNSTITLLDTLRITNQLHIQSPHTTLLSNGYLVLTSNDDEGDFDSAVLALPIGSTIEGDVWVERFIPPGRVYRYVTFPTAQSRVGDLQPYIPITGTFDNPSTSHSFVSTSPSLYRYEESLPGWQAFPASGSSFDHTFETGRGYSIYVRDNQQPTRWRTKGPLHQGMITLPVSYTAQEDGDNAGWNLVGNPFACAIYWDAQSGWVKENVNNGIAIRDNTLGIFRYWDNGIGSLVDGKIAKGQAFWVKASGENPVLQVNEEAKASTAAPFYRENNTKDHIIVSLHKDTWVDKTFIRTNEVTSDHFNPYDFPKLSNDTWNIAVEKEGKDLAIATYPRFEHAQPIPLKLSFRNHAPLPSHMVGTYTLASEQIGFEHVVVYLIDHTTMDTLLFNVPYHFDITTDPNTYENRFSLLIIHVIASNAESIVSNSLIVFPNPTTGFVQIQHEGVLHSLVIYDRDGKEYNPRITKIGSSIHLDLHTYPSGMYFFRATLSQGIVTKKIILTKN
jgi:hypothetical protein